MNTLQSELPYVPDSAMLFEAIADEPWAMLLDSGPAEARRGRYDILVADPMATLVTRGERTELRTHSGTRIAVDDPFALLREQLGEPASQDPAVPFRGGAVGYFGYDLGRRIERLPTYARDDERLPELAFGIYDWALVVDHVAQRATLVGSGRDPRTAERWAARVARFSAAASSVSRVPFHVAGEVRTALGFADYAAAFARIKHYIREGDCYQVNFAQRFSVGCSGDPWLAYRRLRRLNPAPFAAYLNLPFAQVLSASPERFLRVDAGVVTTQPIKGTRPRSRDPMLDRLRADELRESIKDRAENVMIVDLLRNDLSKNCEPHSVRVPKLFELQSFATVHHLVSTVTGRLRPAHHALDLLRGAFPGGSITGAPKIRAMEIIEELEPFRRGVYCGAIGYVGFDGAMDTNIVIRTLTHARGRMRFWAGGGIVMDSTLEGEYQESLDKAAALLELLGEEPHFHYADG
ncbi:MAG: aminodeoxychorismate synthase component I [Thiotrichales bacterium]